MRRLWDWLFGKRNLVSPFLDMRTGLRETIALHRPDLLEEFEALGPKPLSALGQFLDTHFPRSDVRWGLTSATRAHVNLRHYLENSHGR